jgi:hypothetical protein
MLRAVRAFGRFWWDFLVGDTPEIALGALVVLGIAVAVRHDASAAAFLVPVAVAALLAASAYRGRRR